MYLISLASPHVLQAHTTHTAHTAHACKSAHNVADTANDDGPGAYLAILLIFFVWCDTANMPTVNCVGRSSVIGTTGLRSR
jgi:hypothetical protein